MTIYRSLSEIKAIGPLAVALGNFDGVHKGHQVLMNKAVELAEQLGLKSAVFTFTNHPANVIAGRTVVKGIMNFDEKAAAIEKCGIDYLISVDFDEMMRTSSPADFCTKILKETLNAKACVCGFNFSFAYKAEGTPSVLEAFGKKLGYLTCVLDPVTVGNEVVSSTLIRGAISSGRVDSYIEYTGRPYSIEGIVIHGKHLGRCIGFPTVNLALSSVMALPANGVYITRTYVTRRNGSIAVLPSVTNVGNKPTVGDFEKNAETHIFSFSEDLYGDDITVEFIKMIRSEQKFDSLDALQEQIRQDCLFAKNYHGL